MPRRASVGIVLVAVLGGLSICVLSVAAAPPAEQAEAASPPAAAGQSAGEPARDQARDQAKEPDDYQMYKLLVDTLDQVERNYVKQVSRRELIEAAIRGVLHELDPYSAYIGPDDLDQFRTTVDGNFGGIGIQIGFDGGVLTVLSPLVNTPAYRAGIVAGDRIIEIDGKSTKGISLEEAVRQLKGEPGTQVTLSVVHPGASEPQKVTVTREMVRVETVLGDHRKPDDQWEFMLEPQKHIAYVRLTAFTRETPRELQKVLTELSSSDLRGLILDLRFNPGGLLSSAVEVCDLFVSQGTIVSTSGRASPPRPFEAKKEGTFEGFRMVVLVNRFSASASEIVAACLQDHHRAVIMGERTWGKGSVQNVIPLAGDQSALKLTTASYLRPNGKSIHRFPDADEDDEWGVRPDEGYQRRLSDEELLALVRDRRQRDVLRPRTPKAPEPKLAAAATLPAPAQPAENSKTAPPESDPAEPQPSAAGASPPQSDATSQPEQPETADHEQPDAEPAILVDPQLKMAVDYLSAELARADARKDEG